MAGFNEDIRVKIPEVTRCQARCDFWQAIC